MDRGRTAAVFDIDRTLVVGTSMEKIFLHWLVTHGHLGPGDFADMAIGLAKQAALFPRQGYIQYHGYLKGKSTHSVEQLAGRCFREKIAPRVSAKGRECLREHRQAGHLVVLLSGSILPLVEQLAALLRPDHVVCTVPEQNGRAYTGRLVGEHVGGRQKAIEVARLVSSLQLDLSSSFCYADHHTDLPMLSMFGNPVPANPDARLARLAQERGWQTVRF